MITISFGKPRVTRKEGDGAVEVETCNLASLFNFQTLLTLSAGVAMGIIMKQQSDIHSLKRTIDVLQRGVFYG